jgi:hypothetical protein
MINDIKPVVNNCNCRKKIGLINGLTVNEFTTHLRNENWEWVCNSHGLDLKFNTFLNIIRIYKESFPTNTQKKIFKTKEWITKIIKVSCKFSMIFT